MQNDNPLVGTWKLISFELRLKDGTTMHPWGNDVVGQVMYSPDGFMTGCFMKRERAPFAAADVMSGTPQEFETAMKSYVGYAGPYTLYSNRVIHHAEVSWFPNWIGTDIERYFEIQGNSLTLSTPPMMFSGTEATAALVWEKQERRSVFPASGQTQTSAVA